MAGLVAIDVGSSRIKFGWFPPAGECEAGLQPGELNITSPQLKMPEATLVVPHTERDTEAMRREIDPWLEENCPSQPQVLMASVHPPAAERLESVLPFASRRVTLDEISIEVRVDQPQQVGIDRLLNAVAADCLRSPGRPAIVIDLGTAVTVDLVSPDGAFEGGAILPGTALGGASLQSATASLPRLLPKDLGHEPSALGKSTHAAIAAGLYWGTIGGVSKVVEQILANQADKNPSVFCTGGEAGRFGSKLEFRGQSARLVPHLLLSGISIVAEASL